MSNSRWESAVHRARDSAEACEVLLNYGQLSAGGASLRRAARLSKLLLFSKTLPSGDVEQALQARARLMFPTIPDRSRRLQPAAELRRDAAGLLSALSRLAVELESSKKNRRAPGAGSIAALLLTLLIVGVTIHLLDFARAERRSPAVEAQEHFYRPKIPAIRGRAELGLGGKLIEHQARPPLPSGFELDAEGLLVEPELNRSNPLAVRHYVLAGDRGVLTLRFPPKSAPEWVWLFLWGADTYSRSSRIRSEDFDQIILADNRGSWVAVPVSSAEQKRGRKRLEIYPLTARGAALSAVLVSGFGGAK